MCIRDRVSGKQKTEINQRIRAAFKTYSTSSISFLSKNGVSYNAKVNVYRLAYMPILAHGYDNELESKKENTRCRSEIFQKAN